MAFLYNSCQRNQILELSIIKSPQICLVNIFLLPVILGNYLYIWIKLKTRLDVHYMDTESLNANSFQYNENNIKSESLQETNDLHTFDLTKVLKLLNSTLKKIVQDL